MAFSDEYQQARQRQPGPQMGRNHLNGMGQTGGPGSPMGPGMPQQGGMGPMGGGAPQGPQGPQPGGMPQQGGMGPGALGGVTGGGFGGGQYARNGDTGHHSGPVIPGGNTTTGNWDGRSADGGGGALPGNGPGGPPPSGNPNEPDNTGNGGSGQNVTVPDIPGTGGGSKKGFLDQLGDYFGAGAKNLQDFGTWAGKVRDQFDPTRRTESEDNYAKLAERLNHPDSYYADKGDSMYAAANAQIQAQRGQQAQQSAASYARRGLGGSGMSTAAQGQVGLNAGMQGLEARSNADQYAEGTRQHDLGNLLNAYGGQTDAYNRKWDRFGNLITGTMNQVNGGLNGVAGFFGSNAAAGMKLAGAVAGG